MSALLLLLSQLRADASIVSLDWEMSRDQGEPSITFSSVNGETFIPLGKMNVSQAGVPVSIDAARRNSPDSAPHLPESLAAILREEIASRSPNPWTSYVHFQRQDGYLAMMPWEQMLYDAVGVRFCRLPYFALQPARVSNKPCAAIIIDPAEDDLDYVWRQVPSMMMALFVNASGRLHVFGTADALSAFQAELHRFTFYPEMADVRLHRWPNAPSGTLHMERRSRGNLVANPWLRWVIGCLSEDPVECVFLVCEGRIVLGQGAMCFPSYRSGRRSQSDAMIVSADELDAFFIALSAVVCAFVTRPLDSVSSFGLRLFADNLSQRRPSLLSVWDGSGMMDGSTGYNNSFAYTAPKSWSHACGLPHSPWGSGNDVHSVVRHANRIMRECTLALDLAEMLADDFTNQNIPHWLASAQRFLESWAGRLLELRYSAQSLPEGRRTMRQELKRIVKRLRSYAYSDPDGFEGNRVE